MKKNQAGRLFAEPIIRVQENGMLTLRNVVNTGTIMPRSVAHVSVFVHTQREYMKLNQKSSGQTNKSVISARPFSLLETSNNPCARQQLEHLLIARMDVDKFLGLTFSCNLS